MTTYNFELKIDLIRTIPFILDAILEVGVGVFLVSRESAGMVSLIIGFALILIGTVQLIRKMKTFHLSDTELVIRRPLFPFAEVRFPVSKIRQVKFVRISRGGPHLNVITADRTGSFMIATSTEKIDEFELNLKSVGIIPIRDGM